MSKWRDLLRTEGKTLGRNATGWLEDHGDDLEALAGDELGAVMAGLREKPEEARLALAGAMPPEEFLAYMRSTTAELEGIAAARVRLMDALLDLGIIAGRQIGRLLR